MPETERKDSDELAELTLEDYLDAWPERSGKCLGAVGSPVLRGHGHDRRVDTGELHQPREEAAQHSHQWLHLATPLQGDDHVGLAQLHLVVLQGLADDTGYRAGGVEHDQFGFVPGRLDQGRRRHDLLQNHPVRIDRPDEPQLVDGG